MNRNTDVYKCKGFALFAVIVTCSISAVFARPYRAANPDILRESGFESEKDLKYFKGIEIGNKAVYFRNRKIGDAIVQGDYAAYHFDSRSGKFKDFRLKWRDDLPDKLTGRIISKESAELAAGGHVRYSQLFILSEDSGIILMDEVPSEPCWIVETLKEGRPQALIIDAREGKIVGQAALAPSEAFSLTGPTNIGGCSGGWYSWYSNAANWFSTMGYQTESVVYADEQMMELNIKTATLFYELAHGGSTSFSNGCNDYTSWSEISTWLTDLSPVPFSFVGSCGGLCSTGPGSLSYSLRKGISSGTAVVGYCGMADAPCVDDCWYSGHTVPWQNRLFEEMNKGKSVGEAFDIANTEYPGCSLSECMRFDGDRDVTVVPKIIRDKKNIIYVDSTARGNNNGSSWKNAFTELRTALQSAEPNTHIYIARGVYKPADPDGSRGESFILKNGLELYGGFPGGGVSFDKRNHISNKTVLSGDLKGDDDGFLNTEDNCYHVLYAYDVSRVVLDGLTITGGNADSKIEQDSYGGGLYLGGSARIENCIFTLNQASYGGGAYFGPDNCCVTNDKVKSSIFENNHALVGGGAIWVGDSDLDMESVVVSNNLSYGTGGGIMFGNDNKSTLENCTIKLNQSGDDGGGIYTVFTFSTTITGCDISDNTAGMDGGGIYQGYDSTISFIDCELRSNSAYANGGGLCIHQGDSALIDGCVIEDNNAMNGGGIYSDSGSNLTQSDSEILNNTADAGGGLYTQGGNCKINGSKYYINRAVSGGGILYNAAGSCQIVNSVAVGNFEINMVGSSILNDNGVTSLINCSFVSNSEEGTSGINILNNSEISIHNSIVLDTIESDEFSSVDAQYSNIPGYSIGSNIDIDPEFERTANDGSDGWGNGNNDDFGDLRLKPGSPCYNHGNNSLIPQGVIRDIDGLERIAFGTVDMGAYESHRKVLYELSDPGSLGGDTSRVMDINNNGQAVGWSSTFSDPPNSTYHAAMFTVDGNNTDLGTLGGNWSQGWSINNNGLSVGQSRTGDDGYVYHSALFDPSGFNKDLGDLGGGSGWAYDINDSGVIVGTTTGPDRKWKATLFDPETGINTQIFNSDPSLDSGAWSVNNHNEVVGYAQNINGNTYPFLFDLSPMKQHISLATYSGQATGINDDSVIIGNLQSGAVVLNQADINDYILLGTVQGDTGSIDSNAKGLNNNGQIVGKTYIEDSDPMHDHIPVAVLFDPTGSGNNINLNKAISSTLNWQLTEANGINDHGWIVGNGINAHGQYRGFVLRPIVDNFMTAHWKLDDTGKEAGDSVNGHHGTIEGGVILMPGQGRIGGAAYFNGDSDSYIDCGNGSELAIKGQISVCAWIKVEAFDKNWQAIVTKGDRSWRLSRNSDTNTIHFACTGVRTSSSPWVNGKTNVNDGRWHHVAGVYNGTEILLYVDGLLDGRIEARGQLQVDDSAVLIGENSQAYGRNFKGWIDDVRIYSYPLNESDISGMANLKRIIKVDESATGNNDGTTWPNAYNSLQDALHAANPGDKIYIAEGTYRPDQRNGSCSCDRTLSFELFVDLEIYGGFPAGGCKFESRQRELYLSILSGDLLQNDDPNGLNKEDNSYNVVKAIDINNVSLIDGIVIENGYGDGPSYEDKYGGGLLILNSSIDMVGCVLRNNHSEMRGGGLYAWTDSRAVIVDSEFINNESLAIGGGVCSYGDVSLSGCLFKNNTTVHGGGGFWGTAGKISDCIFAENTAEFFGGGIHLINTSDVSHCLVFGNRSKRGAGIISVDSDINIHFSTIYGNIAEITVGGIYSDEGSLVLDHSIVWGNIDENGSIQSAQIYGYQKPSVDFCCIQGLEDFGLGTGNFDMDPLFADISSEDFHLKSAGGRWDPVSKQWAFDELTSWCIDAGNPSKDTAEELLSIPAGDPGYLNQRINIGMYGGSDQASMATEGTSLLHDITNDKVVDLLDMAMLSQLWDTNGEGIAADFDKDGDADINDLLGLVENWMKSI